MFRAVEHPADLAVEIDSPTRQDLFADAIRAAWHLLAGPDTRHEALFATTVRHTIKASGHDDEEKLVGLVGEFLYLCQVSHHRLCQVYRVSFAADDRVTAVLDLFSGENSPPLIREIKAATYHQLKVVHDRTWKTKIVFDV